MSNVRDFGAKGDGRTDDTDAILHALNDGDGTLEFSRGDYLISRTIHVQLRATGRVGIVGQGGTPKILMTGAGPAFHLHGTHAGTAHPEGFKKDIWAGQRMPTVLNLEIEGRHQEADGIQIEGVMQATLEGVLLRELRHGVHITRRARNVLISHCHIYHNSGVGVFLDHANLHQVIVTGSHISYNAKAGIQILGGEIRNFQFTGNDIEYNYRPNLKDSADVLIDCRPNRGTINEGTISSNTIQARLSPGGANIRVLGNEDSPERSAGMLAISGNLIGSQETNIHLDRCRAVTIDGNMIYSASNRNIQIDNSRSIVVGANSVDHNTDWTPGRELSTGVRIANSRGVVLSGLQIQDSTSGGHQLGGVSASDKEGLLEIIRCNQVTASGLQLLDGVPHGLVVQDSQFVNVTGCSILEQREKKLSRAAVRWTGSGEGNTLLSCSLSQGVDQTMQIDDSAKVTATGNVKL